MFTVVLVYCTFALYCAPAVYFAPVGHDVRGAYESCIAMRDEMRRAQPFNAAVRRGTIECFVGTGV